ncbi:MAG: alginate export family protein [Woeseiaceae bacterium]|nr:alginate export family protein [Woeseiaceae bacterium]NIP19576.1 alginate export family protein [Woeseiaceae bacterium]NIS88530.1 alginate export family protein [Woeseiaceae bacterium]
MKRRFIALFSLLAALPLVAAGQAAGEEGATDLNSAITSGKAAISGRYRYEHVDQDNALKNANASTLRFRLNYRTGQWKGWSAFTEFEHIFHVLIDDFNSGAGTSPNRDEYSVVADPKGPDLNQLYFDLDPNDNWKYRFGRQRINLDNQRFVGGVGWRQNEQTFDAATINTKAIAKTALSYTYLNRVRRIFGQSVPAGKERLDGHLLNAKISISDSFSVTPYLYHLDYADAVANSSTTLGARAVGSHPFGSGKLNWLAELARQSDAGDNPTSYDADYVHLNAAYAAGNGMTIGIGYELLGADSGAGTAFSTPLATLHAFNGWADQFLSTPAAGLEDFYVTFKAKVAKWNLTGVYHDFSSDTGGFDYGDELDASAAYKINDRYGLLLKAAFFSADSSSPLTNVDTNKFWVMLTANY